MAASSYMPPVKYEKTAALKIKTAAYTVHNRHEEGSAQQRFFLFCRWADMIALFSSLPIAYPGSNIIDTIEQ